MTRINKACVIGSGIMGGSIAALCASAGIPTLLLDILPPDLKDSEKNDREARNRIVKAGLEAVMKSNPPAFMDINRDVLLIEIGNLEDDINRIRECDIIIEVIVEKLEIKQQLFSRIEKIRNKDTIVVSNTSGLPLKAMSAGRAKDFTSHFMIMHFFNPPRYMKLVELVKGPDTKKDVCDMVEYWAGKILGKGVVWAKDTPNFVGNRIGVAMIARAFRLLESGKASITDVDAMFSLFGFPRTGIFGLCDLIGLDIIGHLAANSYKLLIKDEFRDMYKLPEFVMNMLNKKMLGNKTRENGGFYKTEVDPADRKKVKKVLDIGTMKYGNFDANAVQGFISDAKKLDDLAERQRLIIGSSPFASGLMAFLFVYVFNRVPEISDTIAGIDNAMKWGYSWENGPFEIWDNYGLKRSLKLIEDAGLKVPNKFRRMVEKGIKSYYTVKNGKKMYYDIKSGRYMEIARGGSLFLADIKSAKKNIAKTGRYASLIDLGDGVFNIEYHSKMNAINKAMLDFISEAGAYVADNGAGLVIGNQAGSFSAGGDLSYMLGLAKQKKYSEIDGFIRKAHETIMGIKYSPYPVVAAPYGMTLGGGCETCLAADRIVAHAELYMGLVEIGAGLIPGGGGMIQLWQRYAESVPPEVKSADLSAYFAAAFLTIARAKVSGSASEARNMMFLRPADRIVFNRDHLIMEAKKEVLRMADDGYKPPVKKMIFVLGKTASDMVLSHMDEMKNNDYIPPHMGFITQKIAFCMSGGEASRGPVPEDFLLGLEREIFVELWKTDNTVKMAEHIMKTGKSLML